MAWGIFSGARLGNPDMLLDGSGRVWLNSPLLAIEDPQTSCL